jgi:hypothetical protein
MHRGGETNRDLLDGVLKLSQGVLELGAANFFDGSADLFDEWAGSPQGSVLECPISWLRLADRISEPSSFQFDIAEDTTTFHVYVRPTESLGPAVSFQTLQDLPVRVSQCPLSEEARGILQKVGPGAVNKFALAIELNAIKHVPCIALGQWPRFSCLFVWHSSVMAERPVRWAMTVGSHVRLVAVVNNRSCKS